MAVSELVPSTPPARAWTHRSSARAQRSRGSRARRLQPRVESQKVPLVRQLWRNPGAWVVAVVLAIPAACAIDAKLALTGTQQWGLAAFAWLVVVTVTTELPRERRLVVLCFLPMITAAEFLLSHQQGWYAYRLDNIPPWIPPAHGIVFLTALRAVDARRVPTVVLAWTAAGGQAAYCLLNLLVRGDELGAALGTVYLVGMVLLPADGKRFYAGLGLVVAYLEIVGSSLGTWAWAPGIHGLAATNPPSGAIGGYAMVDGAAFVVAACVTWSAARLAAMTGRAAHLASMRAWRSPSHPTEPSSSALPGRYLHLPVITDAATTDTASWRPLE